MVNFENYEEYIIRYTDKELSDEEENLLIQFLILHPELQDELELYKQSYVSADLEEEYTGKENLFKKNDIKISKPWIKYSIAAGIAVLIGVLFFKEDKRHFEERYSRVNTETTATKAIQKIELEPEKPLPSISSKQTERSIAKNKKITSPKETSKSYSEIQVSTMNISPQRSVAIKIAIEQQPVTVFNIIPKDIPDTSISEIKEMNRFIAVLPISDTKKEGLNEIKNVFENTFRNTRKQIKNTDIQLNFANRSINL